MAVVVSTSSPSALGRSPSFAAVKRRGARPSKLPPLQISASVPSLGPPPDHLVRLFESATLGDAGKASRRRSARKTVRSPSNQPAKSALGTAAEETTGSLPRSLSRPASRIDVCWSADGMEITMGEAAREAAAKAAESADQDLIAKSPTWSARCRAASAEVSRVALGLSENLDSTLGELVRASEERERGAATENEPGLELSFHDPVLEHAKLVDARVRSRHQPRPEALADVTVLSRICAASKEIDEEMRGLLSDGWINAVWTRPQQPDESCWPPRDEEAKADTDADAANAEEEAEIGEDEDELGDEVLDAYHIDGLPSLSTKLRQVMSPSTEFSKDQLDRIQQAFLRFKVAGTNDLHSESLSDVLIYLGYIMTAPEPVQKLIKEVTTYDYLDFDEFLEFMRRFVVFERTDLKRAFDEADDDGSGEMSLAELRQFMSSLGVAPLRGMMKEALDVVDKDGNGQLDFTELMRFLVVYKHAEGFTREECRQLRHVFDRLSEDGAVPVEELPDAVVRVFGDQIEESAKTRQAELMNPEKPTPEGLSFPEFLIFARRSRDSIHAKLERELGEAEFKRADANNNGLISYDELISFLELKGFVPLRRVVLGILPEVMESTWTPEEELDFDQFNDFMMIYRQRDGFSKEQTEEFLSIFRRFDADNCEEISSVELGDIFRYLGYSPTLEQVQLYVGQVDANGSGELDFREFLRLMKIHRTEELESIRKQFVESTKDPKADRRSSAANRRDSKDANASEAESKDPNTGMLHKSKIEKVLSGVVPALDKDTLASVDKEYLDFDDVVGIADKCRRKWVLKERKKAGYPNEKIASFREKFGKFDKDGSGEIDNFELQKLLQEFGWQPRSKAEREVLMERLDMARTLTAEAGVEDLSAKGSSELKFWEFVQLARMLQKDQEEANEKKMEQLKKDLQFATPEVDQFRQIFFAWALNMDPSKEQKPPDDENVPTGIHREVVRRKLKGVGVNVTPQNGDELIAKLRNFEEGGLITFASFLRTMRWLLDTNFGGINDVMKPPEKKK